MKTGNKGYPQAFCLSGVMSERTVIIVQNVKNNQLNGFIM